MKLDFCVETKGKADAVDSNTTSFTIMLGAPMGIPSARTEV